MSDQRVGLTMPNGTTIAPGRRPRARVAIFAVAVAVLVAGCSANDPAYQGPGAADPLVGRPASDLEALPDGGQGDSPMAGMIDGRAARVVWRDGEDFFITADCQPERLDLAVDDGVIVAAYLPTC